jgi:hypothetical protein
MEIGLSCRELANAQKPDTLPDGVDRESEQTERQQQQLSQ